MNSPYLVSGFRIYKTVKKQKLQFSFGPLQYSDLLIHPWDQDLDCFAVFWLEFYPWASHPSLQVFSSGA